MTRTERVTVLMTPSEKAAVRARAAALGVSSGAVLRSALDDNDERLMPEEEAELQALIEAVNEAVPQMRASIQNMIETLDASHRKIDAFLRSAGVRA